MRISDWSSDVCSSDLDLSTEHSRSLALSIARLAAFADPTAAEYRIGVARELLATDHASFALRALPTIESGSPFASAATDVRSEEHTSELQSLMRLSSAVFCLKNKTTTIDILFTHYNTIPRTPST